MKSGYVNKKTLRLISTLLSVLVLTLSLVWPSAAQTPVPPTIQYNFPGSDVSAFREVHTRGPAGQWKPDAQGLVGSIPNDEGYSFFFSPASLSRQSFKISSTFMFVQQVDYSGAGVGVFDLPAPGPAFTNLRCELSLRQNHVVVTGWLNSGEGGFPSGVAKPAGKQLALGAAYTLTLDVQGTTASCLLDGQQVVSATIGELAKFPDQVHPALFLTEANARFTNLTASGAGGTTLATTPPTAGPTGVQVAISAYGKDETDGSDVGWNSQYPNPSFDDDPNRKGLPNARWQGSYYWQSSQLCLAIKGLEAPYPPANTLAIGYTVNLQGATFDDGSAGKTFVLYRFSGTPAQKETSQCYGVRTGAATITSGGAISLAWMDFGLDRVGSGSNANPDGTGDGYFKVSLNVSGTKTVSIITLFSSDDKGNPASGQVWNTAPDGYWILGVYRDGKRLNPQDTTLNDPVSGQVTYELFANDSGYFKPGQYFGVTVRFSDGTEVKAVTQASATPAATPVPGPAASPAPPPTTTGAPGPAPKPTDTMLMADERSVAANGTVTIPIRLLQADRLGSLNFTLRYDPLVLKVNRAEVGDLARGGLFQANTREAGIIRFGIAVQGTEGITGAGPLAHVEFTAIGARGGRSELTILDVLPADTSGARLRLSLRNGRVTIAAKLKGDYDGDGKITAKDALAALKMSVGDMTEDINLDMDSDNRVSAEDARRILGSALSSPTDASLINVPETTPPVASPIGSPPTPGPTTQIVKPSEGAKLTFTGTGTPLDGLILYLPPRAIQGEAPVTLQVSAVAPPPSLHTLPVGRLDGLLTAVGPTVRIKPDSAPTLNRPAEVTIPFDRSLLPAGFDPKRLSVLVVSEKDGRPIYELINDTKVNPQSGDITFQLSHFTDVTGLAQEGLEDLAKGVILGALGEMGGVADDIGGLVIDPITSYFTTPDERALDAAFNKFIEGAGSIAFPEVGLAIKLGKVIIGGATYTVEAAIEAGRQQKVEGTIFGVRSFFAALFGTDIIVANPFWDMNVLKTKGITDDTIGDLVKNEQQLQELWSLYKNQLIGGPMGLSQSSRAEVDERMREAWPYLQKYWRAKRLASLKDQVRLAFERRAREVAKKLRERKEATPPPQPQVSVYKLKGASVTKFQLTDGYQWTTVPNLTPDGAIWSFVTPAEGAVSEKLALTWAVPQTIEAGKDAVITVTPSSTITPSKEISYMASISGGFSVSSRGREWIPQEWKWATENLSTTGEVTGKVTCKTIQGAQRCSSSFFTPRAVASVQKVPGDSVRGETWPVTMWEVSHTLPATARIVPGTEITLVLQVQAVLDASGRDPQRPNCCFWKSTYKGKIEWTYRAE